MWNRRHFLASSLGSSALAVAQPRPKNVLVLIADDLGLNMGCYGDSQAKTPNLDRLSSEGVRFENAYCTTASCSPSRSVMLTGLYNHANGQFGLGHAEHNFWMRPNIDPLPNLLKPAGYRSGYIAKLHVNAPKGMAWDYEGTHNGRNVQQMAEMAKTFMEADPSKPFYLHMGYADPHRAAQGYANRAYAGVTPTKYDPATLRVPGFLPDNGATRGDLAEYYESVNRLDQGIGMMMDVLKQTGQWDNTMVVFLSDNGMPFPNAKTSLYDASTRLPLLVRAPGVSKAGAVSGALASWVDLTPTILDWAGAKPPAYALQGRSWLPVLGGGAAGGWDRAYFSHTFHEVTNFYPMRALRTPRFRYIRNLQPSLQYPMASDLFNSPTWQSVRKDPEAVCGVRKVKDILHRPAEELFDSAADPLEGKNLAGDPAHRETLLALRKELTEWRRKTGDPFLAFEEAQMPALG
jgi:N-sulfoglucosamine sulfohydrolase